jgi:hypothetical protein
MSKKLKETSHRASPAVWAKRDVVTGKFTLPELGASSSSKGTAVRSVSVKGEALGRKEKRAPEGSPLDRFFPTAKEMAGVEARQARRLAMARTAFLKEFGSLERPAADWERLRRERKIFTVTHRGATYIPSFQLDEKGNPRPAIARVIQILGKDTSDWGLALWFTAASSRLDGKRPVDLLSSHPEEVVQAAEQEAAELVF